MFVRLIVFLAVLALPAPTQTHSASHVAPSHNSAIHNVFWQPNQLHQGSPIFLTVELERPARRVTGNFVNKPITFFPDPTNKKTWHALAGVALEANPGDYSLDITAMLADGHLAHSSQQVTLTAGDFKTGEINVAEKYVNPTDSEQKQIVHDELLKKHAYARGASHPLWSGDFIKPVNAPSTPSFGESRILNEEKTSLHTGTDFPTPEGTPVLASNSGTVVLISDLFYEGNTVIIDHGLGVFTVYLHMSRIDVHEGDKLAKGAKLGLSGASGRVTGPHLHISIRWNGVWLDPVQFLGLTLPKINRAQAQGHPNAQIRRRQ